MNLSPRVLSTFHNLTKMVLINLLWFASVCLGLVFVGLFPACAAGFICIKDYKEFSYSEITRKYINAFKANFVRMNLVFVGCLLFGIILTSNFMFIKAFYALFIVKYVLFPVMVLITVIFGIFLVNIFTVNANFDLKTMDLIKQSVMIGVAFPQSTLILCITIILVAVAVVLLPGLIPAFSITPIASVSQRILMGSYARVSSRLSALKDN